MNWSKFTCHLMSISQINVPNNVAASICGRLTCMVLKRPLMYSLKSDEFKNLWRLPVQPVKPLCEMFTMTSSGFSMMYYLKISWKWNHNSLTNASCALGTVGGNRAEISSRELTEFVDAYFDHELISEVITSKASLVRKGLQVKMVIPQYQMTSLNSGNSGTHYFFYNFSHICKAFSL